MQERAQRDDKEAPVRCKQKSWLAWAPEDGKKRNTEVAETGAQRAQSGVVSSGWRSGAAGRRGGSFEIWAGTGATMGKGSVGVYWK